MSNIAWKHKIEFYGIRLVAAVVRRLPREKALLIGGRLGLLAGMILKKRFQLAVDNLTRAFPEWSQRKIRTMTWVNFQHIGICAIETLLLDMLRCGGDEVERYFDCIGFENLDKALAQGKGAILITGHLGFWEAGGYIFAAQGYDAAAVTKPLKNPLADTYITNLRESFGSATLDSRNGARRILKALHQGKIVGILLDQHISPPGSIATEFFGRQAYTTTAITNLAMKYKVPIVPAFCERLPSGRYQIKAEPMMLLSGDGDLAVKNNTQLLTKIIEQAVRRNPGQWFWMHKRWRVPGC